MKRYIAAIMYTAIAFGATPSFADTSAAAALRSGDMKKLVFRSTPEATSNVPFQLADGAGEKTLDAYKGKHVLINFWATWCAPCRKEMPELSALQSTLGGTNFAVVTIATGPNPPDKIAAFFKNIKIDNLPSYRDPRQALAREMGVLGLPATILLDREGQEIARLLGDANWHSDSALAIIQALIEP